MATSPKGDKSIGFVVKLYHMVNGAPDDILSWTDNGESFRISDLSRLESETLPSYFRHSRFQSLVRQLNFYNFRKVNRERNIWIYHHPLFHRDRPQDLGKLRRRTCPGFDGRKQKITRIAADDEDIGETAPVCTVNSGGITTRSSGTASSPAATTSTLVTPESSVVKISRSPSPSSDATVESKPNFPFYQSVGASIIDTRSSLHHEECMTVEELQDRAVHLHTVSRVSRELNAICVNLSTKKQGRRGVLGETLFGFEKSEMHYSKIKCDLLTYDDEIGHDYEGHMEAVLAKPAPSIATSERCITPSTFNEAIVASLTNTSLRGVMQAERAVYSKLVRFFLTTHPQDKWLEAKISNMLHDAVLREKFHAYSKALDGGDLKRSWVTFALNQVGSLMHGIFVANDHFTKEEMNAVQRCKELWFKSPSLR